MNQRERRQSAKLSKTNRKILNFMVEEIARGILSTSEEAGLNFVDVVSRIWEMIDLGHVQVVVEDNGEDLLHCRLAFTPEGEKAIASLRMH